MNISLRNWIIKFENGYFEQVDRKTQIEAGWYDWFCKDSSLKNKTYKMGNIIKRINNNGKVDLDKNYVFFKNNCPCDGPLYDDFRICDLETGDVIFTIQLDSCWEKHKYAVYGKTPDGVFHSDKPIFECDNLRELVTWLNTKWDN